MEILETQINDVKIIKPRIFNDQRGFFFETLNIKELENSGINFAVVQENCAYSLKKGTIRGLHFQNNPKAQAKIVRCTKGAVMDFAIDLRKNSTTYLHYVKVLLSENNKLQLYIPKGFAHGVISLEDDTMIEYFTDNEYSPEFDRAIRYNDPQINIDWGIKDLILSEKDINAKLVIESDCNF
ncbi:MAG: dTDP-4-dehydrorhamnose 3,5-epimerase [Clostridiales bacterium]|nr:dTDP-4-dehydrorhamnose 3,5-epimerase [Clostridiales bacterium]